MRIAAWSGPRNLSTAMMYAFAQRADCDVRDEPFYAAYLSRTGLDHPMREAVLASQPRDAAQVPEGFSGTPHLYLKLMAHHALAGFPMDWAEGARHLHLIRHPARVIASYGVKRAEMTLEDIGFPQQAALFERFGGTVLDSVTIRADPEAALRALCAALELPFDPAMLSWPSGGCDRDGAWAPHWYGAVHGSTGFADPEGPLPVLEGAARDLCEAALPYYEALEAHRLRP
ncbi:HAD family hydrolase [Pseudoroseicyclus aestuarii]|nr:HAD family hydrolase [Pseudoroseicyclus aestuarii]